MIDALSADRFYDLVAAYGADPDRWPDSQRGAAVRCLVETQAARTAWRDAADVDTELDGVPGPDVSADLMAHVLAIADTTEQQNTAMIPSALRYVLPYAAAAAIALVVGIAVPSPFRDATGPAPQDEAAVTEPETFDDTSDGLTTLALVDVRSFADDEPESETGIGDALDNDDQLAGLPLL